MKNYQDKSFEYVIPNTKALKNWLIFEHFHFFFHWNFAFWDIDYFITLKNAKESALEVGQEAAEVLTLHAY